MLKCVNIRWNNKHFRENIRRLEAFAFEYSASLNDCFIFKWYQLSKQGTHNGKKVQIKIILSKCGEGLKLWGARYIYCVQMVFYPRACPRGVTRRNPSVHRCFSTRVRSAVNRIYVRSRVKETEERRRKTDGTSRHAFDRDGKAGRRRGRVTRTVVTGNRSYVYARTTSGNLTRDLPADRSKSID